MYVILKLPIGKPTPLIICDLSESKKIIGSTTSSTSIRINEIYFEKKMK